MTAKNIFHSISIICQDLWHKIWNCKIIIYYVNHHSPNISHAIIAVNIGAEDLIVSEKETATYFSVMREHTIVANLEKEIKEVSTGFHCYIQTG